MPQEREIEVKFSIPKNMASRITTHPALVVLTSKAPIQRHFATTYFDTKTFDLFQTQAIFRIRHDLVGGGIVQTIKMPDDAPDANTLANRREWEWPLTQEKPDLDVVRAAGIDKLLPSQCLENLVPAFTGDIARTEIQLAPRGGQLELAIDQGDIRAMNRTSAISEVEIELKQGPGTLIFDTAIELCEAGLPLRLSAITKSERGYAMLGQKAAPLPPDPARSSPIRQVTYALHKLLRNMPEGSIIMDEDSLKVMSDNLHDLKDSITLLDNIPSDTRHAIAAMTQAPDLALLEPQATITFLELIRYTED